MKHLNHYILALIVLAVFSFLSCQPKQELKEGTGYIDVTGGKVWYKIAGSGDKTPLLLLHGGPGFPSYYLNPMAELGKDRPVIFFDQLGCGRSDRDIDTSLMTMENFVEQVEQVRQALGLNEFYLYGQSWGSMLGVDYYLKYPRHIKAMILASPPLKMDRWVEDANKLILDLPDSVQTTIKSAVENNTFDSQEFENAMNMFYEKYVIRKLPWDANIDSTFGSANFEVYGHMWGPTEFVVSGILDGYDRTLQLGSIDIPTLYICGEYDEATPSTVKYYQSLTPGSKIEVIKDAAHITMHDNPEKNNEVIRRFLREMEE